MSYTFSRDRTAELRDSFEGTQRSNDDFGPARTPTGYNNNTNPFPQDHTNNNRYNNTAKVDAYEMQPPSDIHTMQGFFDEIEKLKDQVRLINENIDEIEQLHNTALVSFNEQQWAQMSSNLDRLKNETQKRNLDVKNRLKAIESSNGQFNKSDGQIRRSQSAAIKKRFLDTIQRYQDIERSYQQKYRQRVERQIRIVKPEATEQEIDSIIDSDESPQVFTQSLMQASRRGQARAVLSEVQNRHDDIKKIEKTILELHQLFMDMQMLVEQQGETLNQVEEHAETTAVQMEEGNKFVSRAIKSARATRHKKWCCFVICIILAVVIAILVWWFGFGHPGVGGNTNNGSA
ncbi:t-SNARE [Halteromyces radiatus]|uniref:t-SNARE n=1 Tax=Halteromyces radiatus TaxID=101107 RepID=UPI00221E9A64|nr:t-SNARE [Halteromyces radiatus]KAI8084609.1 t-SNARE [Halteromyces radiatus]